MCQRNRDARGDDTYGLGERDTRHERDAAAGNNGRQSSGAHPNDQYAKSRSARNESVVGAATLAGPHSNGASGADLHARRVER